MKYLEPPDIPEFIERELQRLHAIIMHFGMDTEPGKWSSQLISEIHKNYLRPRMFAPLDEISQNEDDVFELSGRA